MFRRLLRNSFWLTSRHFHATVFFPVAVLFLLCGCAAYPPGNSQAGPAIKLSSTTFNFKTVALGQTATQTLHLTNSGLTPLQITGLSLSNKEFVVSGPSVPRVVLPNMGLDYTLAFAPTAAGSDSAALEIDSNAVNSVASVSLAGAGQRVMSNVQVSPSALNFGNLSLQATATKNVTLQNSGDINIAISGITVVGAGFGYSDLSPGFSLAPNQSVTFQVWFRPQVKGSASGTVSILSANLASPATLSLTGDGVSPAASPTAPPSAPAAVQHTVHLTWNPSSSVVAGYRVYRSQSANGGFAPLSSSLVTSVDYSDDTVVSGTTYYYAVTAVTASGQESSYSNEASGVVPTP